jgi:hypothetical protein
LSVLHHTGKEVPKMHQHRLSVAQRRKVPTQFSWVAQRLAREHYMDALSPQACALSLFLLTVAEAQGLSYYSEPPRRQRLAMSQAPLHQARHELIARHLVAYRRPLSPVWALGSPDTPGPDRPSCAEETVDITAVCKRIWAVLS